MMKVPVLEIFGPTFQGEGAVIGRKTMFVRTAGCDYSCSWCDSAFTWDGSQKENIRMMSPEDIFGSLDELAEGNYNHVTISGGNPALLKNMEAFVEKAKGKGIELAMETQGTVFQEWMKQVDDVTVSPKPPSSNMNTDFDRLDRVLAGLDGGDGSYNLKVVVFDDGDFEYAATVHLKYPSIPFYLQVGNPYLGNNVENHTQKLLERYGELVEKTMEDPRMNDARVLPQLHTLLWSNKQGV
ncbi:7-carboxy-7-deazaguanine synthase QueE [Salinicoccus halodurans]|uniref:7-carboxy-7-deazaguanine synthase n=1 Tax=Salinicoccus halodurans TaxID=407035 RepID=A0A0F7HJC3_9STAP|nr:7-carboxy-7-deazaguanine synthase QueE [Salinicoccus halodurans]AKG73137.1 7-carboxy-7-deazaguanine synthase [Salinicoccus halodurans]SFK84998.1 preQ(0) biosynthesis protein QueE [Salinicoccus halodurans]